MANPHPESDEMRARTKALKEAEEKLSSMNISSPLALMPKPIPPGTIKGKELTLVTNVFGIRLKDPTLPLFRYDLDVYADREAKRIEFTKKAKDDYLISDRKMKCFAIAKNAFAKRPDFFGNQVMFYDGQSILYCMQKLPMNKVEDIVLSGDDFSNGLEELRSLHTIHFTVKAVSEEFQVVIGDARRLEEDIERRDRSALQFIDIATSSKALAEPTRFAVFPNGKIFLTQPWNEGFNEKDCMDLGEGKRLYVGATKAVRLIEGPKGRGGASPALVLDSLKCAIHEEMKVIEKAAKILNLDSTRINQQWTPQQTEKVQTVIKGLWVQATYGNHRKIQIAGISKDNALSSFETDTAGVKRRVTVGDYLKEKYNCTVQFDRVPLVTARERGKLNSYPMELLKIIPMQRVTIPQQSSEQSKATTRACAVVPSVRKTAIQNQMKKLGLDGNEANPFLEAASMEVVAGKPLTVVARHLAAPAIKYGNGATGLKPDMSRGSWRANKNVHYLIPARCSLWALYAVIGERDPDPSKDLMSFAKQFIEGCRYRGMQMGEPAEYKVLKGSRNESVENLMKDRVKMASQHNCQFVFFVTADMIKTVHSLLKLEERHNDIITQDLKLSTMLSITQKGRAQTMENIVNKTNIKLGGVNYSLDLSHIVPHTYNCFPVSRLIVGVGVSHPPPSAAMDAARGKALSPTVVGYSMNRGERPTEYIGDFHYQEARREEMLTCMPELMKKAVEHFRREAGEGKAVTAAPPTQLIIYRSGISEGSYPMIIRHEVPLIKSVLAAVGVNVGVTYIVAQKEHNVRLFLSEIDAGAKATDQNIPTGTLVDQQLTHPQYREFYLNSHSTLQGTARTPRYTVLVDDNKMQMDELETITHSLAFNFQIVNLATSLPAPLYIANRYAERGRALHNAKMAEETGSTDSSSSVDYEKLNAQLPYYGTRLSNCRVNA